jgi:hypothetical protein
MQVPTRRPRLRSPAGHGRAAAWAQDRPGQDREHGQDPDEEDTQAQGGRIGERVKDAVRGPVAGAAARDRAVAPCYKPGHTT